MIPFLPDKSAAPATLSGAGGVATAQPVAQPREGGAALDFAGLLNAAMPAAVTLAQDGTAAAATLPPAPLPSPPPLAPRLPSGTILPDGGAGLPVTDAEAAPGVDAVSADALTLAPPDLTLTTRNVPETAVMMGAPALVLPATTADAAEPAPATLSAPDAAEADAADDAIPAPTPIAAAAAAPIAVAALLSAAPPAPAPAVLATTLPRSAARVVLHPAALPAAAKNAPPSDTAGMMAEPADAPAPGNPAPASAPLLADAAAPATPPAPAAPATSTPALAAPMSAAPVATPIAAERSEPRAPAANQESTIAAVGEIREALRTARPEMTLRHAEFGFVSLRLEPVVAGQQDWRAVLASRDPGFVPAIQAALAERTVAAAADTASTGTGQNSAGAGQNSPSDARYGASPNGGQGSSQPYMGQSSGRDEGGSSPRNGRQPSTTDTVANRAGEADAERADPRHQGVFA